MELSQESAPEDGSLFFSPGSPFIFLSVEPAFILFFIYLDLIYNDVLVSDVQQSDSVTHSHIHVLFFNGSFDMIPFCFIYLFIFTF